MPAEIFYVPTEGLPSPGTLGRVTPALNPAVTPRTCSSPCVLVIDTKKRATAVMPCRSVSFDIHNTAKRELV